MRFSIIIPVYNSHGTIERCLEGVGRLAHPSFEVILVDSSPDDRSAEIARRYPRYTLIRSGERMLMHAARNAGLNHAVGDIVAFLDPDCIPATDWLNRLEAALGNVPRVVGGGIALHPGGLVDLAAHIVKFWPWLPGEETCTVEDLPTANFALPRRVLEAAGGFRADLISGDTELCHRLRRAGHEILFDGRAVVHHIHETTIRSLVRERFTRAIDFAMMRAVQPEWNRLLSLLVICTFPLLALRQCYWKFRAAAGHGLGGGFLRVFPIVLVCDVAWMTGVAVGKARALLGRGVQ